MQNFDLDHDSITGKVGDKLKVTINNIKPDNVTNGNITATSQDPSIVTVTPELNSLVVDVDLLKTGNTTITFKSNDGAVTKLINVVVKS